MSDSTRIELVRDYDCRRPEGRQTQLLLTERYVDRFGIERRDRQAVLWEGCGRGFEAAYALWRPLYVELNGYGKAEA